MIRKRELEKRKREREKEITKLLTEQDFPLKERLEEPLATQCGISWRPISHSPLDDEESELKKRDSLPSECMLFPTKSRISIASSPRGRKEMCISSSQRSK